MAPLDSASTGRAERMSTKPLGFGGGPAVPEGWVVTHLKDGRWRAQFGTDGVDESGAVIEGTAGNVEEAVMVIGPALARARSQEVSG